MWLTPKEWVKGAIFAISFEDFKVDKIVKLSPWIILPILFLLCKKVNISKEAGKELEWSVAIK